MTNKIAEGFLQHVVKFRKLFIIVFLLVFIGISGVSYFLNGRTYKSGVEFYIFKSFDDSKTENNFLLTKEEIEILKSIATSEQLFLSVVNSQKLVTYYNKKFSFEAEDILKNASTVTIDEHSKISIYAEDLDKYFAFGLADAMRKKINVLYNDYLKTFKKSQILKFDQGIHHYYMEKQNIERAFSQYPSSLLSLKFLTDSLNGPNYIKKINKCSQETGIKITDVMGILNLFHRLEKVQEQIYLYTDLKQQIQNALYMLDRNHTFITNKNIHFKRTVDLSYHFILGLKFAVLADLALILLITFLNWYKTEFNFILKSPND